MQEMLRSGQRKAWLLRGYHSGLDEDVSEGWRRADPLSVCGKERNKSLGNQRPASFIPVARKILQKIIKRSVYKHLEDNKVIKIHQHGFEKNKSCQASFSFYSERMTGNFLTWARLFLQHQ